MRLHASTYVATALLGIHHLASAMPTIVGGQTAGKGAAPYMVSIRQNGQHHCGGSLINSNTVLTAAHCLTDSRPEMLTVVAGSNSLTAGGEERAVAEGIGYPYYNTVTLDGDLARRALPEHRGPAGTNVTVFGWGLTNFPSESTPRELHVVSRNTISTAECEFEYSTYDGRTITERQVCTQTDGQGACYGDSGGPLVWIDDDKVYQVGIVSSGVPCADRYPDVFTKVGSFLQWIELNST